MKLQFILPLLFVLLAFVGRSAAQDEDTNTELGKQLKEALDTVLEKMKESMEQGKELKQDTVDKLKDVREKIKDFRFDAKEKIEDGEEKLKNKIKETVGTKF